MESPDSEFDVSLLGPLDGQGQLEANPKVRVRASIHGRKRVALNCVKAVADGKWLM
jgi:hypothetical protein